mgnify:CR=1 FL=1
MMVKSAIVLIYSVGIQEETTVLGRPCIAVKNNTKRPITIESGTNIFAGIDPNRIIKYLITLYHKKI